MRLLARMRSLSALVLVLSAATLHAQTSDDALVSSLFPPSLDSGARLYAFARADLDGSGSNDYIVAAYCDGVRGAVRVIHPATTSNPVVDETSYPAMVGATPFLRILDLNGDGKPEIIAVFGTVSGGQITWPFRWSGGHLLLFGPSDTTSLGVVRSLLGTCEFFDIDGDGKPEIIDYPRNATTAVVFKLGADGAFSMQQAKLAYVNRFVRHEGDPELFTAVFPAAAGGKLVITIVNGDTHHANAVTSGDFYFNGQHLLSPNDFKNANRKFSFTETAEALNEIEMDMAGKPGTEITVSVAPQQ